MTNKSKKIVNKLHALFLWMIFPGVIFAWFMTIYCFQFVDFFIDTVWPEFKANMKQYLSGVKGKWNE